MSNPGLSLDSPAYRRALRIFLFLWVALITCPIRYWPSIGSIDNTWVFAHNFAQASGLFMGRDIFMTTGPLGWFVYPQDVGNNLVRALWFQSAAWLALLAIWADLFFLARFPLPNLALFSFFFALSGPLYWFNYMGLDYLLLGAALVLLFLVRLRGGMRRYLGALAIFGIVPLIKTSAAFIAAGALLGFLFDTLRRKRSRAWPELALACTVPAAVFALGCCILLPSLSAFVQYLRLSLGIASGFGIAMSKAGALIELAAAGQTLLWIAVFIVWGTRSNRPLTFFCISLLAIPLFMSLKHGFVRQDSHVVNFFCFAGLAFALISLAVALDSKRLPKALLIAMAFSLIWVEYMTAQLGLPAALSQATGWQAAKLSLAACRLGHLRAELHLQSVLQHRPEDRLEPQLHLILQSSPVASLSLVYSGALLDGLNLKVFPSVQRYLALIPELDRLNANWIRDQGPRFLTFDGSIIEWRHPWAETPAMWLEIYRWYNTRSLTSRTLLLERRPFPRFYRLLPVARFQHPFAGELKIPTLPAPLFWTMRCPLSLSGKLRNLMWRVPEVTMTVQEEQGGRQSFRVVPGLLVNPVLGSYLPNTLGEFATLFDPGDRPNYSVRSIQMGGPGASSYNSFCETEFLAPQPASALQPLAVARHDSTPQ